MRVRVREALSVTGANPLLPQLKEQRTAGASPWKQSPRCSLSKTFHLLIQGLSPFPPSFEFWLPRLLKCFEFRGGVEWTFLRISLLLLIAGAGRVLSSLIKNGCSWIIINAIMGSHEFKLDCTPEQSCNFNALIVCLYRSGASKKKRKIQCCISAF